MRIPLMLSGVLGLVLSAPAHALISLHVAAPHSFTCNVNFRLGETDPFLVLIGLSALIGAAAYRFIKAR